MLSEETWSSLVSQGAEPVKDSKVWPWERGLPVRTMGMPHAAACVFSVPLPCSCSSAYHKRHFNAGTEEL